MSARYIAAAVLVASAICLFVLPPPVTPAEPQVAATNIDFDALHSQATAALEILQNSHQRRVASVAGESF